jgi:hypothetical protein
MRRLLAEVLIMFLAVAYSVSAQTVQKPSKPSPELQAEGEY